MNKPDIPQQTNQLATRAPVSDAGAILEPLSWVLGEIRAALTLSSASLLEAVDLDAKQRIPAMLHATAFLHQAHGALLMLEIAGVGLVSATVEILFDHIRDTRVILTPELAQKVDQAYQAIYEYLDELQAGAPQQSVRLFPYYRDLMEAMGAERIHPADLFFPKLDRVPALSVLPVPPASSAGLDPAGLRQRFERSLLQFLKTADPANGAVMAGVLGEVASLQSSARARAGWWVLQGFAHAVATRQINSDMLTKQLFGRINKQMRQLGQADVQVADDVLHDALFFVARAPHPSSLLRAIRDAYGIDGQVPADFEKKRYGRIDLGALNVARERLSHAKGLWGRIVHGDQSVVTSFEQDMDALEDAGSKLNSEALSRLLVQLNVSARHTHTSNREEAAFLEIATGLLVVESALKDIRRLPEHFAERTDAMTDRLRQLGSGVPLTSATSGSAAPDAIAGISRQAQEQAMATLAQEMQSGLLEVERILDAYFRHQTEPAALTHVVPLLHQIEGALAILEQDAAVRALQHTQSMVAGFSGESAAPAQSEFEHLAQNIGALGLFMDALRLNPLEARKRFIFDQSRNVFHVQAPPRPVHDDVLDKVPELLEVVQMAGAAQGAEPVKTVEPAQGADAAALAGEAELAGSPGQPDGVVASTPSAEQPKASLETSAAGDMAENAVKQIGTLQIGLTLYGIYLAETAGLVEVLTQDLHAWRLAPERYVNIQAVHAAHSLAGSSATVGLTPVHEVAYAIEAILQHQVRKPVRMADAQFDLLTEAVACVRGMLQQFREGEIPAPVPQIAQSLEHMLHEFGVQGEASMKPIEPKPDAALAPVALAGPEEGMADAGPPALPQALLVDAFLASRYEIDAAGLQDAPDADLLPIFLEEARDILPQIGQTLRDWRHHPEDSTLMRSLQRMAHTMKGSARMAGAMRLGQHMHHMEARVENCLNAGAMSSQLFDDLLQHHDRALQLLEQLAAPAAPAPALPAATGSDAPASDAAPKASAVPAPVAAPLVRVRADILDRLVNQAGEVSISRSRLETEVGTLRQSLADLNDNVQRLREQLREVEIQAESQIAAQASAPVASEFDALEFDRFTRLQELTRMMAESVDDVGSVQQSLSSSLASASSDLSAQGRLTRDLQQDLMRVRMVQFGSLSDRLYRVVRQTAKEVGKRVNLDIRGAGLEVDRGVLDRMIGPFEHLLRNAIVHGIETEEVRRASGKRETGDLSIDVRQEGNEVVLQFADDGSGLDLQGIRARAIEHGLLAADGMVTDVELSEMVFQSGFSTATEVTESAGRGIGMDVVRMETAGLGGTVAIGTEAGQGTRVTIRLPLTLAVTQVVLLSTGGRQVALPSILVEQVVQLKAEAFAAAYHEAVVTWQGQRVPMVYLSTLLGDRRASPLIQAYAPIIILKNGSQRLAVHVDQIHGNREVVVKNIGPQLARVAGISGATVMGSGEIILIVNPLQLVERAVVAPMVPEVIAPKLKQATVLVVDDSLTVRRVTQRMLTREGYEVVLAKDGQEALELLQTLLPEVILLDIEMPRMDGFDLTRRVRADDRLHATPIIMITSRTAAKHRQLASELGVNGYLGKPFQEQVVLDAIAAILKPNPQPDFERTPELSLTREDMPLAASS